MTPKQTQRHQYRSEADEQLADQDGDHRLSEGGAHGDDFCEDQHRRQEAPRQDEDNQTLDMPNDHDQDSGRYMRGMQDQ